MHRDRDKTKDLDRDNAPGRDANRDPITGEPGAHPVGTGAGAAAAGVAGGLIGSLAGPIGTAVGAAIGGVAGGLAGKGVAEAVNPTEEDTYWRQNYASRDYVDRSKKYDDYAPAYRMGWESCCVNVPAGRTFDQVEPDLAREWDSHRGRSGLGWMQARPAARDAWDRAESRVKNRVDNAGNVP
jgi:hypothetical protein